MTTRTLPRFEETVETLEAGGLGALQTSNGNLPLKKIDVRAQVHGLTCQTVITQVFHNSHDEFVEATYIFPLPGRFAVTACTMRVQDRVISAELQERSEARANYDRAIRDGHRASIAEEERSETFNLRVGNIPPHEDVTVELTLAGSVSVVAGEATFRIPLVVSPRYVSGQVLSGPSVGSGTADDTNEVPDASRVTPPTLLPGFPSPVALSVEVELDPAGLLAAAGWRDTIRSSLHSVFVNEGDPCRVRLLPGERVDRDFILRFPVLAGSVRTGLDYAHSDSQQAGTFTLTVLPPRDAAHAQRARDVVFVLDRSGSMSGWKMVAARRAVARMIDSLREGDQFRVLAFDNAIEMPCGTHAEWQAATDRQRWAAAEWVAKIESRGGTELGAALQAALRPFGVLGMPESRESIVVVVTDGQVAGEDSVLRTISKLNLPRMPRIFTMGIDRAVNASMLQRLADMGGGSFELVESEARLDEVMERFHRDIGAPVLTDLRIQPLNFDLLPGSITPMRLPDLFADHPLTIHGRVVSQCDELQLRVTARDAAGNEWSEDVSAPRADLPSILALWGRGRVRDLEDQFASHHSGDGKLQNEIVKVSLESHVLSRFTAYVAVDHAEVVNEGGRQHKIVQPVEQPEGWELGYQEQVLSAFGGARSLSASRGIVGSAKRKASKLLGRLTGRVETEIEVDDCFRCEVDDSAHSMIRMDTDEDYEEISFHESFNAIPSAPAAPAHIDRIVELLLTDAVQAKASHVYIRPEGSAVIIRQLVKDRVIERDTPPRRLLAAIVGRLQVLAGLQPQSGLQFGVIKLTVGDVERKVRLYVIPTPEGPSALLCFAEANLQPSEWPTVFDACISDARACCGDDPEHHPVYAQLLVDCHVKARDTTVNGT